MPEHAGLAPVREEPLDAHLPDPVVSYADGIDPEDEALVADSVGLALLVALQTMAPAKRPAFVLHDMFDIPFDEISPIVGRSCEHGEGDHGNQGRFPIRVEASGP